MLKFKVIVTVTLLLTNVSPVFSDDSITARFNSLVRVVAKAPRILSLQDVRGLGEGSKLTILDMKNGFFAFENANVEGWIREEDVRFIVEVENVGKRRVEVWIWREREKDYLQQRYFVDPGKIQELELPRNGTYSVVVRNPKTLRSQKVKTFTVPSKALLPGPLPPIPVAEPTA